jgi:hypothetical protein
VTVSSSRSPVCRYSQSKSSPTFEVWLARSACSPDDIVILPSDYLELDRTSILDRMLTLVREPVFLEILDSPIGKPVTMTPRDLELTRPERRSIRTWAQEGILSERPE